MTHPGARRYYDLALTSDGILVAPAYNGYIYTYENYCSSYSAPLGASCGCLPGYYSDDGMAPCSACPSGSISNLGTSTLGSTSCVCAVNYYSDDGLPDCVACPANTYNTAIESSSCIATEGWDEVSTLGSKGWFGVASSSDGGYIYSGAAGELFYKSTDRGITWAATSAGWGTGDLQQHHH